MQPIPLKQMQKSEHFWSSAMIVNTEFYLIGARTVSNTALFLNDTLNEKKCPRIWEEAWTASIVDYYWKLAIFGMKYVSQNRHIQLWITQIYRALSMSALSISACYYCRCDLYASGCTVRCIRVDWKEASANLYDIVLLKGMWLSVK